MINNDHLIGTDVDVYYNLHRKCWSIRDRKTRRVVGHTDSIVLSDVTFHVSAAGNARVRREGKKNVHAFARGTVQSIDINFTIEAARSVTYNPYRYTTFVELETERPVHTALLAGFDGKSVVALDTNPLYGKVTA